MSVFIYQGGLSLVKRSGVGQAIAHQRQALREAGIIARDKADSDSSIIHLNTVFPDSLIMALVARIRGWKVVYYAHSTAEDFRRSFPLSDSLAPLFRRYITFCYSRADVVVTPTEYSRSIISGYGIKAPVYAISNGVDITRFRKDREKGEAFRARYGIGKEEKVVISVALPIERKGILEFISLARTMSDVRFIWFGSLSTVLIPSRIRKAISAAPLNVLFPGFVDQRELVEAYSGADCFLFMSYEETEGIAVLEALSSALPVVLRAIPVYSSLAGSGLAQNLFRTQEECRDIVRGILDGTADDVSAIERGIAKERSLWRSGIALRKVYREELHEEP